MPPSPIPALQLANVHVGLEAEGDVSRRVVQLHRAAVVAVLLGGLLPLFGDGLGEVTVKALGAGGEVGLRVDAYNLPVKGKYVRTEREEARGGKELADFVDKK